MFIKLTRSGGRSYAQLVESFRDELSRPRQRTLATLGRIDEVGGQVDAYVFSPPAIAAKRSARSM